MTKRTIIYSILILLLTGNIAYAQNVTTIDSLLTETQQYVEQEQYEEALALCRKALSIDSIHPDIYNQMGITLVGMEKYDSAMICYQKAIDIEPRYVWPYYNMGVAYDKQEKYEQAIPWLEKAANMYETPDWLVTTTLELAQSGSHYQKGLAYEEQGDIDNAITEWILAAQNRLDAREKLQQYGRLPDKYKETDKKSAKKRKK